MAYALIFLRLALYFWSRSKVRHGHAANAKHACADVPEWSDAAENTCDWYARYGVCVNGLVDQPWEGSVSIRHAWGLGDARVGWGMEIWYNGKYGN